MKSNKTFQINIPITKIDEEQRIVTGIATTESIDSQGDIVDYDASKKAFSNWLGNIREMHSPIAIGKAIDIQYDDKAKTVQVSAKISESADGENAWIKVKEGVLAGFSIGGRMLQIVRETVKNDGVTSMINRIKDYTLSELSLVDNPANPDAMLSMVKSIDGHLQRVEAEVEVNNKLPDSWWMEKFMSKNIKKSVYDAQVAIEVASQIAYLLMCESGEDEENDPTYQQQITDLKTAFDAIRDFTALEVAEDDTYLGQYEEIIEMAQQAIDVRKGAIMSKNIEKAGVAPVDGDPRDHTGATVTEVTPATPKKGGTVVPKAVYAKDGKTVTQKSNVIGGTERDEEAEVVADESPVETEPVAPVEEIEAEIPVVNADEIVVDEEKSVDEEIVETSEDVAEDPEVVEENTETTEEQPEETPAEAPVEEPVDDSAKSDSITDLTKNVETLLAKLNDTQSGAELNKVTDSFAKLSDKVEKSLTSLEGRITALESQPMPTKAKASFAVIAKGEDEVEDNTIIEAQKRQEELIANPLSAKPGEHEAIYRTLRNAEKEGKE